MATEELSPKNFTRERVRNRMLKRAAEVWGFPESEMDDFDPLVTLLIEACSVEFEKISGEIGKTQNRMLERLAQLLYPGMIDVSPAYGIMQVRSSEPFAYLNPDAQFFYKPSGNDRQRENQQMDLFFSPAHSTKMVDGSITHIATARELFSVTDGLQRNQIGSSVKKIIEQQHVLWLGLDLNGEVNSLDEISFFFNWINQPEAGSWYTYLPYTEWSLESIVLAHRTGLPSVDNVRDAQMDLEMEFDPMQKIEAQVNALFNRHYITLTTKTNLEQLKVKRRPYPPVFEQLFDKKELQELKEPLLWIEIRFPPVIPAEALDSVWISMNAIPVINRKLNQFNYKLVQSLNIVPLETVGYFLSMKGITNSQGQPVKLIPFANPSGLMPESYTLRYGVNRFDERNAQETLVNLTELIREESSFFSSLGEDFLIQNIRELNQVLARIDDKVKMHHKNQSPYPFLAIKPKREGGNIAIEFWSCHGALANRIPIGSRLSSYKSSSVLSNSIYFITSTYGGKDKLNDAEKIDQYKKSLLTHNRIVTLEDLKLFVQTELGQSARSISYEKIYIHGESPADGFIRCMQVEVNPEPGSLELQEWEQRLRDLKLKLESISVNNIPYQLKLVV
ncbi:MAG TPA: hypothetical protein VFC34_06145 [Puia sp.]|nr:hypothetical protein [Puia sp.]